VAAEATGGRVEIGSFNYDWRALTADVAPFVLHGSEPPSSPPFFRARKIRVGLRIISAFKKQVDIASLQVEQPQVHITVAPDGSTNVPSPKIRRSGNFAGQILDLKVRHFELRDGFAEYNAQRIPLDVQGDRLQASVVYDANGPSYRGDVSSRQLHVSAPQFKQPLVFDFDGRMALQSDALQILQATFANAGAKVEAKGSIENLAAPRAALDLKASTPVNELAKLFQIPLEPRGEAGFQGQGSFETSPFRYQLAGKITARGLGYTYNDVAVRNIAVSSKLELSPTKLRLADLDLSALDGHFRGSAELSEFRKLAIAGEARGFALRDLAQLGRRNAGELSGILNGPVRLNGELARGTLRDIRAQAQLTIAPGPNGTPLEGAITVAYDQAAAKLELGTSELTLGSTHATVSGVLGQSLAVHLVSQNLSDALALFPLLGATPPKELPLSLDGGSATFDGTVSGPLGDPRISGKTDVGQFIAAGRNFDRFTATLDVDQSSVNFRTLTLAQGKMHAEGQGRVALHDWKAEESSAISGLLSVTGADIQSLADFRLH
jgi:translocation and assembly module TamB